MTEIDLNKFGKIAEDVFPKENITNAAKATKKLNGLKKEVVITLDNRMKLTVGMRVKGTITNIDSEDTSGFFGGSESDEDTPIDMFLHVDSVTKAIIPEPSKWNYSTVEKKTASIDQYPEEVGKAIRKSLKATADIYPNNMTGKADKKILDIQTGLNFSIAKELIESHTKMMKELKSTIDSRKGLTDLNSLLERYFFKKHLLIQGKKGNGKTYAVDEMIKKDKLDSELIIGHEGIESIDMLGYYTKDNSGNLVWLDGALTTVFRKAKDNKVVLFIDEILRIPARELNILVGSLSPSSSDTFRLRTNRIVEAADGIGKTEMIEIPKDHLWCVATTNVGAGYNIDNVDEALSDRFITIDKQLNEVELNEILTITVDNKGYNPGIVGKLTNFYNQMNELLKGGELSKEVNLRHLTEIINLSDDEKTIKSYALDRIGAWTTKDSDGTPNKTESDIIERLIVKTL